MQKHITLVLALVVVLGIAAQWIAWRLHIPAIVLLSVFGLLEIGVRAQFQIILKKSVL